jgi:restriction system protein
LGKLIVTEYYRVMLGRKSVYAETCFAEGFIGVDDDFGEDLSSHLAEEWRSFNKYWVPKLLQKYPDKSKIGIGLWCGYTWTVCKGIKQGDVVLCPDGSGSYRVGDVTGDYSYHPGGVLPHRRPVTWRAVAISRSAMSNGLRNSCGSIGTVSQISKHAEELQKLIGGAAGPVITVSDAAVEDPVAFAMERHLEDFLVLNWAQTELGKSYEIYEEEGERVGQQYPSDTGNIDILAVSKDKKELLVVELKKGRASDVVVGQILRYMGFVKDELAEEGQTVRGVVIALEDDQRIRRAMSMVPFLSFYRYEVTFKLTKA